VRIYSKQIEQNMSTAVHAFLHLLCAVVVLPYIALALFFIFVGQLAGSNGILSLVETVWNNFVFYFTRGMFLAPILWVCLVVMGFLPSLQRSGSLCLSVLAAVSLIVIVAMQSSRFELGQLLFLVPCAAIVATCAWLALRTNVIE
jgi:hypothetical protein